LQTLIPANLNNSLQNEKLISIIYNYRHMPLKSSTFIEAIYVIFMWNFFKTKYSIHNIWEAPLMDAQNLPAFFKHNVNTNIYESKICPLGNVSAYLIALWIIFRDTVTAHKKNKMPKILYTLNKLIFIMVAFLSFLMNLNAFLYFIPIFAYEIIYK